MAIKKNHDVGHHLDNISIEKRNVKVSQDTARLNDQRKVRPHIINNPPMGIRPNRGAQKEPIPPSDKLSGSYIQARDISIKKMMESGDVKIVYNKILRGWYIVRGPHQTPISGKFNSKEEAKAFLNRKNKVNESKLIEWNPLQGFFQARQPGTIPGDAIGYQITRDGIDIVRVRNGRPISHKRIDSHEAITNKMQELQAELDHLRQRRRYLSINPRRVALQAAWDYATENGIRPTKIGELNREVPISVGSMMSQPLSTETPTEMPPTPSKRLSSPEIPAASETLSSPEITLRTPKNTSRRTTSLKTPEPRSSWRHRGEPMGNVYGEWIRRAHRTEEPKTPTEKPRIRKKAGSNPIGKSNIHPVPHSTEDTITPGVTINHPESGGLSSRDKANFLVKILPSKYNAAILAKMTPYQIDQAYEKLIRKGPGSFNEGYPDTNIENKNINPAHSSRIGNLKWKGNGKEPKIPNLNKEFMQARDISIAKIMESEKEIDEMVKNIAKRMGVNISENTKIDEVQLKSQNEIQNETFIPRERYRWI
jgi:hypothetical protein